MRKYNNSRYLLKMFCLWVIIFISSCKTKDKANNKSITPENKYRSEKAKKLVHHYLKDTLLNNADYHIINFSDLDSSFSNCLSNKDYVKLLSTYYDLIDSFDLHYENVSKENIIYQTDTTFYTDTLLLVKYLKNIDSLGKEMKSLSETLKREFNGWTISNQVEVKNALNKNKIINVSFYFDTSVSKILKYFDDYQVSQKYKGFKHSNVSLEIFKRHIQYRSLKL